ncbi:uncharacterized protein [Centroberyx affinis]|uniref:uncharacterized protein n=1 Tax=Centroberyx affinis TaxID=166261 RepID=UPI003A5C3478
MATKPVARQQRGSAGSLDEWVSESWTEGELGATGGHNPPRQGKQAPRAEPEEDIDVLEPGAREGALQENLTVSTIAPEMEHEESTGVSQRIPWETQETVTELEQVPKKLSKGLQAHEESEKCLNLGEDTFQLPPPLSASPTEEGPEKEDLSSLEGEVAECISDAEIMSDPTEELTSSDSQNSQEWPQTPQLTEPVDRGVKSTSEETAGDSVETQEEATQLNSSPGGQFEYNLSGAAAETNPSRHNSDDAFAIDSPPFADEVEDEEEVSVDSKPLFINSPVSSEQDPASTQLVIPPGKQQREQLPQSQCAFAPRGANQEAAQQVLSQGSPPLSTVAMEPANQGAAASQGSGCVIAMRERNRRAGERTEGESRRTGGEEGQKESRLDPGKTEGEKNTGGVLKYSETVQKLEQRAEKYSSVSCKHSRATKMESDSCDDSQSDSGVSADFSPCSTLESHTTIPTGLPTPLTNETPIEREIRRAIEREHSLRRSRGLQNPPTTPEYVEIPLRKSVLAQSLPAKSERGQGKDRQFAGKKMQQEIHAEAQREQALVKLGKVPGFYDKGTVRQLKERKQLFEAFQEPKDSSLTLSNRSKAPSWASASDLSTLENQEDISAPASTLGGSFVERRRSLDLLRQTQSPTSASATGGGFIPTSPRGPGFSEGTGCQVIILENNLGLPAKTPYPSKPLQHPNSSASFTEAEALTVVDSGALHASPSRPGGYGGITGREEKMEDEEEEAVPKENPFFKLRSSTALVKVEQDIREAQERERELRNQRSSLYGGTGVSRGRGGGGAGRGGGGRPASIERQSPTFPSPPPLNGLATPDLHASSSKGGTGPPAARQSLGKLGMWPPAQAEDEQISQPEALQSPRTPRQKTPLLQRWESGLVNGHGEEDD